MKRVLIIHSKEKALHIIAKGLQAGFENRGIKVDLEKIITGIRPLSFSRYDLIMVGSPALGFFGGKVDPELEPFLKRCKRTAGQSVIAFVKSKFLGTNKSLKTLMGKLERQGCIVKDFRDFADEETAKDYAKGFKL